MKNIKHIIFTVGFLSLFINPQLAFADSLLYEAYTPATNNYIGFCDGNYHNLRYCEFTDNFSFDSDKIVNAITMYDLGCDSRDEVEMFLSYAIVNADTHSVVAETIHNRHKVCTPNYAPEHNVPTTLEINPTRLVAHQNYYLMLRASNNEHARAYWGVTFEKRDSFQIHGFPAPKDPVILVHGIMGSSLKRVSDGREIWPNVNEMVLSGSDNHLDELKLDANGSQIAGKELEPGEMLERASFSVFGQDLVTQTIYGDLAKQFTDRGYVPGVDLFEVAYDWRLDLRSQVARLRSAVETALLTSPGDKIGLVAHSMGGLLVKEYLKIPDNASLIDKVVLVGVPQLGAPSMFKVLNYGDNLGFRFPIIQKDILNPSEVKAIAQNMPGAYELLPSRAYVAASGGYVKDFRDGNAKTLSYDETASLMTASSSDSRNTALIATGQIFHDALDGQSIDGPKVYNLAACGNPATVGEIRLYDKGKIDIGSADGDGTVPLTSAMHSAGGYSNYFVSSADTGIDHGGLVRDGRATTLIERLAEGVDIPEFPGIATTSDVCSGGSGAFRFSTHSPVALHVYDSTGRHTGPSPDGNVEIGIPNSSYATLGENSFVFVPTGDAYRVVVDGLDRGQFTLKAETFAGSELVASTNYLDVPLAGASTAAEATFSSSNMSPALAIDANGDGMTDADMPPTAQLFSLPAADSEPPQISFSGVPTGTVAAGATFKIIFSASDLLSGIATTSATLDGATFVSGAVLTAPSAGKHTIIIQATDKAGNPRAVVAEFTQAGSSTPTPPVSSSTQATTTQQSSSGNSGNQNSSNQHSVSQQRIATNSSSAGTVLGTATTTQATQTPNPPVCLKVPVGSMGRGRTNDKAEVLLLQAFLNRELKLNIPLTGFFGPITELAVKIFQLKHYADVLAPVNLTVPTGFVGKYTLAKIGTLACV